MIPLAEAINFSVIATLKGSIFLTSSKNSKFNKVPDKIINNKIYFKYLNFLSIK